MNIPFLSGPARYEPRGQWRPLHAFVAACVILVAALSIAVVVIYAAGYVVLGDAYEQASEEHAELILMLSLLLGAILMALLAWLAAGLYGDRACAVLQLDGPMPSITDAAAAISGYTLMYSVAAALRHTIDPATFLADFAAENTTSIQILGQVYWPLLFPALVISYLGIEILFDGFLLSGLAKSRWGFWPPVMLISLIASYSVGPSILASSQEFLLSIYSAWLIWRSGRLWLAMLCSVWGVTADALISAVYVWG